MSNPGAPSPPRLAQALVRRAAGAREPRLSRRRPGGGIRRAGRDRGRRGGAPLVLEAGLSVRAATHSAACHDSDHIANDVGRAGSARGENSHGRAHRSAVRVADEPPGPGRDDLRHAGHRAGHRRQHRDLQRDGGRVPPSPALPRARPVGALQHDGRECRTRAGGELPRRAGLEGDIDAPRIDRLV